MFTETAILVGTTIAARKAYTAYKRLKIAEWCKDNRLFYIKSTEWILSEIREKGLVRMVNNRGTSITLQEFWVVNEGRVDDLSTKERKMFWQTVQILESCRQFLMRRIKIEEA